MIWEGLTEACRLIFTLEPVVITAALRSLWIAGVAVATATVIGLPIGTFLARLPFPGRRLVVLSFRGSMAVPTVFIGVLCYAIFSRRPAGSWRDRHPEDLRRRTPFLRSRLRCLDDIPRRWPV